MARFAALFSGSSGNSTYIGRQGGAGILIDAGVSCKRICSALADAGADAAKLRAVFVTHEHTDHISGVRVLCKKYRIPLFAAEGTMNALRRKGCLEGGFEAVVMAPGSVVELDGIKVVSFRNSHDAASPCGYSVTTPDERKITVLTDTGVVTAEAYKAARGSDLILLESNHDEQMLKTGPYDYMLKQRILSDRGHLSNRAGAEAAVRFVTEGTSRLVLGHVSRENNTPELAFNETNDALLSAGFVPGRDYTLTVAPPGPSPEMLIF